MTEGAIPFNKVGSAEPQDAESLAAREGITEAEWRARNLPSTRLEFRWRYSNKTIQLLERRLRSLAAFNVGPAVQAWVRSRLEWVHDNKFYEMPEGVIVLAIDPEGEVDIQQEPLRAAPVFSNMDAAPGTVWHAKDGALYTSSEIRHAADTLVRDLAQTLGFELADVPIEDDDAELFAVSDEFGVIACTGREGEISTKLAACFAKLWTLEK